MESCPNCGQTVAASDTYCHNCGAKVGGRHRPNGITILAVMMIILGSLGLLGSFLDVPTTLLGMILTGTPAALVGLLESGVVLYCGIGFLRMSDLARKAMIGLMIYRIINGLLIIPRLDEYRALADPSTNRIDSPMANTIGHFTGIIISGLMIAFLHSIREKFADKPKPISE